MHRMLLTGGSRVGTGAPPRAESGIRPGSRGAGAAADLQGPGRRSAAAAVGRGLGQRELPGGRGAGAIQLRTEACRLVGRAAGPIEARQNAALAEARQLRAGVGGRQQSEDGRHPGTCPEPQSGGRETAAFPWNSTLTSLHVDVAHGIYRDVSAALPAARARLLRNRISEPCNPLSTCGDLTGTQPAI